jgi:hypothetical protein
MTASKDYGTTPDGVPITEQFIAEAVAEAEAGFDLDQFKWRRPGRPPIGSAAAQVESVRLDPELREALADRAQRENATTSSLIRAALRQYLGLPPAERT